MYISWFFDQIHRNLTWIWAKLDVVRSWLYMTAYDSRMYDGWYMQFWSCTGWYPSRSHRRG